MFTCTASYFAEVDAHRQLATLLHALEALYALKRRAFWAARAPRANHHPVEHNPFDDLIDARPATMACPHRLRVQVLDCPRGRTVRGEYQPRTVRPTLYDTRFGDPGRTGHLANPEAWRVEPKFTGGSGYLNEKADGILGDSAELAGYIPEVRLAAEAYAEATSAQGSAAEFDFLRHGWQEERVRDDNYDGFADPDLEFALAQQDLGQMRLEYAACQRRLHRARRDPELSQEVPSLRTRLHALRSEKQRIIERVAATAKKVAA